MKLKLDRIISIATLTVSLIALILVLKKPAPVAAPQPPAAVAANAESFQQKLAQMEQAAQSSATSSSAQPAEVHLSSAEVSAALAQAAGLVPVPATSGSQAQPLSPDTDLGSGAPTIKDQQISFDGDLVHGQFLTQIAGKDVWVTVSGRLGSKDGYATFEPTEFKIGDLSVPVSLVNGALQKKLLEQRDRLKLPDFVGDVKVQNGELVMTQK